MEMDASDLIRLASVGAVDYEPAGPDEDAWVVEVLHDHDGYAVGLSTGRPQMYLSPEEAERVGLALLRAATAAQAWNDVRARAN